MKKARGTLCSAGSAVNRNRTGDLITTNDALYLLSYDGKNHSCYNNK